MELLAGWEELYDFDIATAIANPQLAVTVVSAAAHMIANRTVKLGDDVRHDTCLISHDLGER